MGREIRKSRSESNCIAKAKMPRRGKQCRDVSWKHLASSATLQTPTPASAVPAAVSLFCISLSLAFTNITATTFSPVPSPFQIIDLTFYRIAGVLYLQSRTLLRQISRRGGVRQIHYPVRFLPERRKGVSD